MIDRFTQKAQKAIRLAVDTAQELEHGYVGTEHLLLGLIKEGTGVAAAILERFDVEEKRVLELMDIVGLAHRWYPCHAHPRGGGGRVHARGQEHPAGQL